MFKIFKIEFIKKDEYFRIKFIYFYEIYVNRYIECFYNKIMVYIYKEYSYKV